MKIRFIKRVFYISSFFLLFFMAACMERTDKKQVEGKVPQTSMPVITEIAITPEKQIMIQISPTAKRIDTPMILPTFTAELFQLYNYLPGGEYLIIGIHKQFALSLDGKQKLPLPDDIRFDNARVFPDGNKIVVVTSDSDTLSMSLRFRIIDLVTGQQTDIPRVKECIIVEPPGLSPDGTSLIFSCGNKIVMQSIPDGKEIGQMVIEDSAEPDTFSISSPVWSRDGKWIAYRRSVGGSDPGRPADQVIVISADCFNQPEICLENTKKFSFQGRTGYNLFDWAANNQLVMLLASEINGGGRPGKMVTG
jgi:Tol biopolymer transport system component